MIRKYFLCPKPNPKAQIRLLCFSHAGGRAGIFREWPQYFPDSIEVSGVEFPGRGMRMNESPETNALQLAAATAETIRPLLDRPFAFFGHSMGALLAFEISVLLKKQWGISPRHLFASAHPAPQDPRTKPVFYNLPESELMEELRRLNGTPVEVLENPELRNLFLPLIRADFSVVQTYVYQGGVLDCPVSAFGGLSDPETTKDSLMRWKDVTTGPFNITMFAGEHFFLNTATRLVCQTISSQLRLTAADTSGVSARVLGQR